MMTVTTAKLEKMRKDRDRHMKAAESENDLAKQLFSIGSKDFAQPLELAHQHYGAAQEIDKLLNNLGYKEKRKLSRREKAMLKRSFKQKAIGFAFIVGGFLLAIPEHDLTGTVAFVALGLYLMISKNYVLN